VAIKNLPTNPQQKMTEEVHADEGVATGAKLTARTPIYWWNCAGGVKSKIDYIKEFNNSNESRPFAFFC